MTDTKYSVKFSQFLTDEKYFVKTIPSLSFQTGNGSDIVICSIIFAGRGPVFKNTSDMKDNSLLSFITGAAVGAALGILFAPEKGEVTRRKIKNAAQDGCDLARGAYETATDKMAATKSDVSALKELLSAEGSEMKESVKTKIYEQLDKLEKALSSGLKSEDGVDNDDDDYDQDDEVIVDVANASKKNGKQIDIA